jgi:hypothetical protein
MRKSLLTLCILFITVVNVVCAILSVRAASKSASNVSSADPRFGAIETDVPAMKTAIDQQTAVLDRAIGEVVPVKMPADFEAQFDALEITVADKSQWPMTVEASVEAEKRLSALIKQLPVWAEPDYLPRLTPLRWSVGALSALNQYNTPTDENVDAAVSAFNSLLDATPDGVPSDILASLKNQLATCEEKASSAKRDLAIAQAKSILRDKQGDAAAAWSALEKWADESNGGKEVQQLRIQLRKQALVAEAERQTALLSSQQIQFSAVADEKLKAQGLMRLYDSAMSQRVALAAEGLESPQVDSVADGLQNSVTELAKKESSDQAAKLRAYQKWALDQIQLFWKAKTDADAQAKAENTLGTSSWNDDEYKLLLQAFRDDLLPISSNFLEPPVLEKFNDAFRMGWQQLDKRPEQTKVAESSATVEKHMP